MRFVVAVLGVGLVLATACDDEEPVPHDQGTGDSVVVDQGQSSEGGVADGGKAKVLDETHGGWKQAQCGDCHKLPETGHSADKPPMCASCHGGNGACNNNGGDSTKKDHQQTDDCVGCHKQQHGFAQTADCVSCHYAGVGRRDCTKAPDPDGGGPPVDASGKVPTLSKNVVANCFNWPAQEFTPANHANWVSSLKVGQLAVELTLKDTTGKSHTLSQLLGSRPVWLQFGSYT